MKESVLNLKEKTTQHWFSYFEKAPTNLLWLTH